MASSLTASPGADPQQSPVSADWERRVLDVLDVIDDTLAPG